MKSGKLILLTEKIKSRSKKPWACFETDGFSEDGLGITSCWNPAFIKHLHDNGIQGTTDQETLQLFFLFISNQIAFGMGGDLINPEATPNLTNEANRYVS